MQSGSRNHCTDNRNRNRDYDDRKRCKTAEKEIRNINIGENIEKRNKTYHPGTWNSSVYPVCSGTDLFPVFL